jgi:predicted O-methyltransferase YrrM
MSDDLGGRVRAAIHAARVRLDLRKRLAPATAVFDVASLPVTALAAAQLWLVRRLGIESLPANRRLLDRMGVFPVRRHYYDPLVDPALLHRSLDAVRDLPGIDLGLDRQLALLAELDYADELAAVPIEQRSPTEYGFANGTFFGCDGAYLYAMIRHFKPRRIYEVGSGNSTLMARLALARNAAEDPGFRCRHVCVEPYEMPWMEGLGIDVVRAPVETIAPEMLLDLEANDILFIDSSHMIRPQSDVLYLYQRVLPRLAPGVVVHIHDVFTPRDYPATWLLDRKLFWNEQYLLEAMLTENSRYEVLAAVNQLRRDHEEALASKFPIVRARPDLPAMSFWMRRR